jgi:hypothetical protein
LRRTIFPTVPRKPADCNAAYATDIPATRLYRLFQRKRGLVGAISRLHSSCERGCQEKILSPPLAGNQSLVTCIQPCLLLRGAFAFSLLARGAS